MVRPGRRTRALAAVALAGLLPACGARPRELPTGRFNVVVVLVDTLRADRLSLYGYQRPTSPFLDRFARERGVVFRRAWANSGCTFPSVNSLLTSRWPQHFLGRLREFGMAIPHDTPGLAERLRARGWATAAVSASLIVRKTPSTINKQGGFDAGFDTFDESCLERPAHCVNARAFELLDRLPEPFFLYLHYVDPHQPYQPPGRHRRQFALNRRAPDKWWVQRGDPVTVHRRLYDHDPNASYEDADLAYLSDLYDEEILYFDRQLERLRERLDSGGLLDRTVLVLASDHGEELGDHGHWGHCRDLAYPTILEVPLVMWAPGLAAGERSALVSNLDLAPTLLDLVGDPASGSDGRSLRPLLERGDALGGEPLLFAAQGKARAVRDAGSMWLLDLGAKRGEAFALGPSGARPAPQASTALRRSLVDWIRARERQVGSDASLRQAEDVEATLRSLGYL